MSARKKESAGVRPGKLELCGDGRTLEVHYESLEVAVLPNGTEAVQSTKQGIKRIKFDLPQDGNLQALAQQIVEGCKLLHAARMDEVEALLAEAQQRQQQAALPAPAAQQPSSSLDARHCVSDLDRQLLREEQQQYLQAAAASATQALAAAASTARIDRLEEYLEALYEEDLGLKTAAAAAVAQLFREPRSLGPLLAHPTLLQALARLLREDAKKNGELCISLLMSFFALSHLPQAHALLGQNQVGSLTMELLDLELRRAEHWQQREGVAVVDIRARLLRHEPLPPQEQRLALMLARQEPLLYVGLSLLLNMAEDAAVELKMVKKGLLRLLVVLLDRGSLRLLVLVTTFLRKMSVYAENSKGLRESEVVDQLAALVLGQAQLGGSGCGEVDDGGGQQLLSSLLRLLHNLSFDEGMRQQMVAAGMIDKVVGLLKLHLDRLPSSHGSASGMEGSSSAGSPTAVAIQPQAPSLTTRLQRSRQRQWREGPALRTLVLGLLYHLSLQDKHRSMFLYTDAIPSLHAMLVAVEPPLAAACPELAALMISLAGSARVAEEMARGGRLEQLLSLVVGPAEPASASPAVAEADESYGAQQAVGDPAAGDAGAEQQQEAMPSEPAAAEWGRGAEDEMLWKLLRAMAEHDSEPLRARFAPTLPRMARLLMSGRLPPAAFSEALGCLSCLDIPGYDYAQLLAATQLHTFLAHLATLTAGGGNTSEQEDTTLLDAVQAVGVLCTGEASAEMLVAAGLVEVLHSLMLERMDDGPLVLATAVTAARFMAQRSTRAALLAHAELVARFAELLQHPSREVARAADAALEAVAAGSEEWGASVQRLKFEAHNREWLQVVHQMEAVAAAAEEEDAAAPALHLQSFYGQAAAGGERAQIGALWGSRAAAGSTAADSLAVV